MEVTSCLTAHATSYEDRAVGNKPTICRKCYVHPSIIESYMDGALLDSLKARAKKELAEEISELQPEEAAVLRLLHMRLDAETKKQALEPRGVLALELLLVIP